MVYPLIIEYVVTIERYQHSGGGGALLYFEVVNTKQCHRRLMLLRFRSSRHLDLFRERSKGDGELVSEPFGSGTHRGFDGPRSRTDAPETAFHLAPAARS